jgi:hypothetical protein
MVGAEAFISLSKALQLLLQANKAMPPLSWESNEQYSVTGKKGKVVPLRSIEALLGERRYSSYSFLTSALEGGEWSASRHGRALPPGKQPPVPTVQEAGWAPEPVWTQRLEEKSSASVRNRTPAVQSVVRHCTDWTTLAHIMLLDMKEQGKTNKQKKQKKK